jgi:hypothetical protein
MRFREIVVACRLQSHRRQRWLEVLAVLLLVTLVGWRAFPRGAAAQAGLRPLGPLDIVGPAGSGAFGTIVALLPGGNVVITDPGFSLPAGPANVGAAYLYDGRSGTLLSALTGSQANDQVGSGGVAVLANGSFVVLSPGWHNGTLANAGAATWGDGTVGISSTVSTDNSLVGGQRGDAVGSGGVVVLPGGAYVLLSPQWANGALARAGAATWVRGTAPLSGTPSAANSLVGGHAGDQVGSGGAVALPGGHYVLLSPRWANGDVPAAGAATWGNGWVGVRGEISAANSLVGSHANDWVGEFGLTVLTNGNYVLPDPAWDNGTATDAGAVTWGDGSRGATGTVSAGNSLVGSQAQDRVGGYPGGVAALANGNYVVLSPRWANGPAGSAGAATWGSGKTGVTGAVSVANSLVGSHSGDALGSAVNTAGLLALANGNYVLLSPHWDGPYAADVDGTDLGAATWADGTRGITGTVSSANSLLGTQPGDQVGWGGVVLANGNYVIASPLWANGEAIAAGAATWGNGATGSAGYVSPRNSLVGARPGDEVSQGGVTALSNGNYVVRSPYWDGPGLGDVGAVTWGEGTRGITGTVSAADSLVGSHANDQVGSFWGVALANGNTVVLSPYWDDGSLSDVGAATWLDGAVGLSGTVSADNSLVGARPGDRVGLGLVPLPDGDYVVLSYNWGDAGAPEAGAATWASGAQSTADVVLASNSLVGSHAGDHVGSGGVGVVPAGGYCVNSPDWDNGEIAEAGAVTLVDAAGEPAGPVGAANSVLGRTVDGGARQVAAYDAANAQWVVARPADNTVTLWPAPTAAAGPSRTPRPTRTPLPTRTPTSTLTPTIAPTPTRTPGPLLLPLLSSAAPPAP